MNKQELFDLISPNTSNNKDLYGVCGTINIEFGKLNKQIKAKDKEIREANKEVLKLQKQVEELRLDLEQREATATTPVSEFIEPSDDDVRRAIKRLYWSKVQDETLAPSELAQFKDLYGLADKKQDINISTVSFKDAYPDHKKANEIALERIQMRVEGLEDYDG